LCREWSAEFVFEPFAVDHRSPVPAAAHDSRLVASLDGEGELPALNHGELGVDTQSAARWGRAS
jgi:hypothetical protein